MCSNFKIMLRFSVLLLLCGINNTMLAYSDIITSNHKIDIYGGNGPITVTNLNPANCTETKNAFELLKNMGSDGTWSYKNGILTIKVPADNVETIPDLCKNSSFDTILTYKNETFVLKDKWYWKLLNKIVVPGYKNALSPGYPKLISQKWSGLPDKIDAAFTDHDDKFTYFFQGSKYWKFDGEKMEKGFPRDIGVDFPGVPNDVRAVLQHLFYNWALFFFKDDMLFHNFHNRTYYKRAKFFWYGIPPNKLEATLTTYREKEYFFTEENYYLVTDNKVAKEDPPYPRPTASYWFGCF